MKLLLSLLLAVLCYGTAQEAGATIAAGPAITPITFSNNFGYWKGSTAGFGTVEVSVGEDGYVHVTATANGDYFSSADGAGIIWDRFFFNVAPGSSLDPASIVVDETVGAWRVASGNISLFGDFDYGVVGTGFGNSTLNTLHFHIADSSLGLADIVMRNEEGWTFAAHLRGFDSKKNVYGSTSTSTYLGVEEMPVATPLPAAFWLLGSGLGCIVLLRGRFFGTPPARMHTVG